MPRVRKNSSLRKEIQKTAKRKVNSNTVNKISKFEEEVVEEIIINKGKIDSVIIISMVLLVSFGVIMVFSASYYYAKTKIDITNGDILYFFKRQGAYAIIGFALLPILTKLDWRVFRNFSKITYFISIVFLTLVLFIGKEINGAKRWLDLGFIGFQPSEVAKVGLVLYLSKYVSEHKNILNSWKGFFRCCFIIGIPMFLIGIENKSTAIIVGAIGISILFVASPTIKYFLPIPIIGGLGLAGMFMFGDAFRMERLIAWTNPFAEGVSSEKGYQTVQSLYAIASGGFFGLGIGQSRQKLGFIPEGHNDIIFSVICEELGIAGAFMFVLLFSMLIWRGYITAMRVPKSYMTYVCVGIITMIAIQVIINIAVVTNTIPNTGIPLPFISYGGTSLLIIMLSTGIVLNFSRYFTD